MFKFFRPHRTPKEREKKVEQINEEKQRHVELVQEAQDVTANLQQIIRGGPRIDVQLRRIQRAMRDRER
jgi:hypothetical protein